MEQNFLREDLLPITVSSFVIWLLIIATIAGWVFAHIWLKRMGNKFSPRNRFFMLSPIAIIACWTVIQGIGRYFFLQGYWHVFFVALLAGLAIEGVVILYEHECKSLKPWVGRRLVICRVMAIVIVLFMLLQPIDVGSKERVIRRTIAILVDDSASMNFVDQQWTEEQKIEIAAALDYFDVSDENLHGFSEDMKNYFQELGHIQQLLAVPGSEKTIETEDIITTLDSLLEELNKACEFCEKNIPLLNKKKHPQRVDNISRIFNHIKTSLVPKFTAVKTSIQDRSPQASSQMIAAMQAFEQGLPLMSNIELIVEFASFDSLSEDEQVNLLHSAEKTRSEIVRKLIAKNGKDSVINELSSKYDIAIYRFGSSAKELPAYRQLREDGSLPEGASVIETDENLLQSFRSATDISKAMETILKEIPIEQLAGVLIFSDGRYTIETGIDSLTRKLGGLEIPVSTVVVGGTIPPYDVALAAVNCPETVFLKDKVRFSVQVNATGARTKNTNVSLYLGDTLIESKPVTILSDDWSSEIKFTHVPETHGVLRYKVVVDRLEDEEFPDNNEQIVDVSVSDDRTFVLLVDDRPRWEFRYLRNLFYGRDKSVHLQELLIHPDKVKGIEVKKPAASADRKFGDSESGSLPKSRDEWRKFDVIILGDLSPQVLTDQVVDDLKYCVQERGALLVFIAGRNNFPHKFSTSSSIYDLIPVEYDQTSSLNYANGADSNFMFTLTPAGRGHPVMSQSVSSAENEEIWSDLPEFAWRFPVKGIKPGAEVLAYARSKNFDQEAFTKSIASQAMEDPETAIRRLEELRKEQERNSLVVARSYGRGKVLMLNTDDTWRLRYRVGDTRHHRFWGQILRWGAGEKLRAGNTYARLGTDQLRYAPDEKIKIFARLVDRNYNAIVDASPDVFLYNEHGEELAGYTLKYREDSNGFYEIEIPEIAQAGVYELKFSCPDVEKALDSKFPPQGLSTRFVVVTAKQPIEFVNITSSTISPRRMAETTNGKVFTPLEFLNANHDYGEGNKTLIDRTELYLWDSWVLFVLGISCLTYEWILRKRVGLA